jgi:REP element-mobilizing transposase RayT
VAGEAGWLPFGDVEKERFVWLMRRLATLYTVEIVSYAVMGNHYHIVLYAPDEAPSLEATAARLSAYRGGEMVYGPESETVREIQPRLPDISWFLRDLQQQFTVWFNRTRLKTRRGALWAQRFKSGILDGETSLWECVKYVELNCVRAGIVQDPAEYRFCSWGVWSATGKHPFGEAAAAHLKRTRGVLAMPQSAGRLPAGTRDLYRLLKIDMARTIAVANGLSEEELRAVVEEASGDEPLRYSLMRRMRHWSDGAIIGGRAFVREVAGRWHGAAARTKQLGLAALRDGPELVTWRRLRVDLE